MDHIVHNFVEVNGVKLHLAEIESESSPVVVFLHGFPEIWYSWRHQMIAVVNAGYRAIAPDSRGYGLSDPPPETDKFGFNDLVNDLLAILDSLGIDKIFIIAKDAGARPAYLFTLRYPTRVTGVISLGVAHTPIRPPTFLKELPEGLYINRWRQPGRAEADFSRHDAKTIVRNIYILFSRSELPIASENQEIMDIVDLSTPLPSWFTEEDLSAYGALYEKSGFLNPLKVPYRGKVYIHPTLSEIYLVLLVWFLTIQDSSIERKHRKVMDSSHKFTEPSLFSKLRLNSASCEFCCFMSMDEEYNITDHIIKNPMLLIVGEKDYFLKFPKVENLVKSGMVKHFASDLEIEFLPEGSHFVQEQFPDLVNPLILAFLRKHS